jgi:hypothetical protein
MVLHRVLKEFNQEIKPDKTHSQMVIQISTSSTAFEEVKEVKNVIEGLGVRIIEMNILSSDFILLKFDVEDMRNIALKLTESGFSVIKGINALTQNVMGGQDYAPDEKISPEEALRCYTLNGAYSTFEEKIKGSIEVGKLADLVVLAEDLTQVESRRIKDITVIATVVGGEFFYEKK